MSGKKSKVSTVSIDEVMKGKGKLPLVDSDVSASRMVRPADPTKTLIKQFGEIDKRTRVEDDDAKYEDKLRVYAPREIKAVWDTDEEKERKIVKSDWDILSHPAAHSVEDVIVSLVNTVKELTRVIEKLPDNVMSWDEKKKIMKSRDIRIHKPLTEKAKKQIEKKKEEVEKDDFLSALDDL